MTRVPTVDPNQRTGRLMSVAVRFAMSKAGRWFAMNVSTRLDPVLLRMSRGRVSTFPMAPLILLTVPGRKSGVPRTLPLLYFTDGDEAIVIPSSFGRDRHPAWYHNVMAHPEVELSAKGRTGRYRARETEGEERARLYGLAEQVYGGYADYAVRAAAVGRTIPVLALSPL